jgi:heptosyltransferase-2
MPTPPDAPIKPRRRILVMRYRFIGDTLLTVPFLRNLRAAYPDAQIDMLVAPNSGEVLRDCPYIDELIMFDTTRKHRYENPDGQTQRRNFWHYVQLLRSRRYDTAFVLKRSFSSAGLAFLAGIPERIGFDTEGRGWMLTRRVPYRKGGKDIHEPKEMHEIDAFLSILEAVNVPVQDRHLESWWKPAEAEIADRLLRASAREIEQESGTRAQHVVLHLTSSNTAKQWPLEHAQKLVEWLLKEPHRLIHCLGAPSDAALYKELRKMLPLGQQQRMHIHCGQLNLLESMAFLHHMNLVVGVDSGTLHMAAAAGVPVVALFGPMNEQKWAPPGAAVVSNPVACRPCNLDSPCRFDFECMKGLRPEAVIETIRNYAEFI